MFQFHHSLFTGLQMCLQNSTDASKPKVQDFKGDRCETVCAVLTGKGRGAVAVIAIRGNEVETILEKCFQPASREKYSSGQIRYGLWNGAGIDQVAAESVVVTPLNPNSAEIHCHGGPAAVNRIMEDLKNCGCEQLEASTFFSDRGLLFTEASEVASRCITARTVAIAMDQQRGAILHWATEMLRESNNDIAWSKALQSRATEMLEYQLVGEVLNHPFRVVLCGPPNVGKSSLLNRLVGYDRSITFDLAGTTRDVLTASTVIDGWPVELSDTAGIRNEAGAIEREGINLAILAADKADLLILVDDPSTIGKSFELSDHLVQFNPQHRSQGILRVLNKLDEVQTASTEQHAQYDYLVSAIQGDGIDRLLSGIVTPLNQLQPDPGSPVPITSRQIQLLQDIVNEKDITVHRSLLQRFVQPDSA